MSFNSIENPDIYNPKLNVRSVDSNPDIYKEKSNLLINNITSIPEKKFKNDYAFACNCCGDIPIIIFMANNKILFKCEKNCCPKEITIREIYKYLYKIPTDEDKTNLSFLKCIVHSDERYSYYCNYCKKNICNKCLYENKKLNKCKHQNKIILFDNENIKNKIEYVKGKIKQNESNNFKEEKDNNFFENIYINNNIINDINDDDEEEICFDNNSKNNSLINDKEKEEIQNTYEKNNDDENYDIIEDFDDLFSLIVYDYLNNTNFNHFETISNAEKYATILFNDFNKINLKYNIAPKNKARDFLTIFDDRFVNNNKENCFLLVGEKIFDLNKYIILSDIFDIKNTIKENYPNQIEVGLIERKNKLMTNLSFMFYGISSLNCDSSFSDFNTTNITNMSYMFYNCSSLKKLPEGVSSFETKNVYNMSYMFYNCSSLKQLPDGIKDWHVQNVKKTDYMFSKCSLLTEIPDISGWDVSNLQYMNGMFNDCTYLEKLFDIEEWEKKIKKKVEQVGVIDNCDHLHLNRTYSYRIKIKFSKFYNSIKINVSLNYINHSFT